MLFTVFHTIFIIHLAFTKKKAIFYQKYGAQNEAYKCLLVDKVVNDLCLS